jgi:hypothetical protein
MENLFHRYSHAIHDLDLSVIDEPQHIPAGFELGRRGALSAHYIPFDLVNAEARLVLVGITPGFTQWKNAVAEAQRRLREGASADEAHRAARHAGAFSGAMRPNLIALLDSIGLQRWLEIDSCSNLFAGRTDLVHTTSVLRHPVFVSGKNYNGSPNMVTNVFLQAQLQKYFAREAMQLKHAVFVPLGPKVHEGLRSLARAGVIDGQRILGGLPHPSGANAERIAYFVGRKQKAALSVKTNAAQLDAARDALVSQVESLPRN